MRPQSSLAGTLEQAMAAGGLSAALTLCRERLDAQPDDVDATRHLAQLLSARGEHLTAQQAAMRACELSPNDSRCWSELGLVHARANEPTLAIPCFREALVIDPQYAAAWHNLGLSLVKLRRDTSAFSALKTALHVDASHTESWIALGELLLRRGQDNDALQCFERAARSDPAFARARSRLGEHYLEHGRVHRAQELFRQALAVDPQHLPAWIGLGRTLEDLGELPGARAIYLEVLRCHPDQGIALGNYVALLQDRDDAHGVEPRRWLAVATEALARDSTPDEARAHIGYAVAKFHDRRGEYAQAAHAGSVANLARRRAQGGLDRAELKQRIDGLVTSYDRTFFATRRRFGAGNDQPVFIVGLPRSGTTLTEQILATHPQVHGAGELPDLARLAQRSLDEDEEIWRAAQNLTAVSSRELAHTYLQSLHAGAPRDRRRIIDKSPLNFFHLAFAAVLFPNARVIHCRRFVRDNALSIWMENFNVEQRYATDFDDLAFFVSQYERLMAHWRAVLPIPFLEVEYESTVADVAAQARRLTRFIDVPWDARCLNFHERNRVVQTPSRWQVREPIYRRSVDRWRAYEKFLPGLASFASSAQGSMV